MHTYIWINYPLLKINISLCSIFTGRCISIIVHHMPKMVWTSLSNSHKKPFSSLGLYHSLLSLKSYLSESKTVWKMQCNLFYNNYVIFVKKIERYIYSILVFQCLSKLHKFESSGLKLVFKVQETQLVGEFLWNHVLFEESRHGLI